MSPEELHPVAIVLVLAELFLLAACILGWLTILISTLSGKRLLPPAETRRLAPWGLVDFLATIGLLVVMQVVALLSGISLGIGEWHPENKSLASVVAMESKTQTIAIQTAATESDSIEQEGISNAASTELQEGSGDGAAPPIPKSMVESKQSIAAKPSMDLKLNAWVQTSQLVVMLGITLLIVIRCRVSASRVGWSVRHIGYDLLLGLAATCLFVPPVIALMATLVYFLGEAYHHPILEMVGDDLSMLGIAVWMAVIVAPITEEFGFRVLLQGYLESMAAGTRSGLTILLGRPDAERWVAPGLMKSEPNALASGSKRSIEGQQGPRLAPTAQLDTSFSSGQVAPVTSGQASAPASNSFMLQDVSDQAFSPVITTDPPILNSNSFAPTTWSVDASIERHQAYSVDPNVIESNSGIAMVKQREGRLAWWPVIVSGVLFGLAHFEYGPSWIPLIILGFVLGWLYRITGRIWPSLVVHMAVNSLAMAGLATQILSGGTDIGK